MARPRPDFATIRLTDAGKRMAGDHGVVRWANSRRHFEFVAGEAQEVERSYEWNLLLRSEAFEGEPILEEVPVDEAGPGVAAGDAATEKVKAKQVLTQPSDEQKEGK